jgi:hypothetical protein
MKLLDIWREKCEQKYSDFPAISLFLVRQSIYRTLMGRHYPETVIRHVPEIWNVLERARVEVKDNADDK